MSIGSDFALASDAELMRDKFAYSTKGMPQVEPIPLTAQQGLAILARCLYRIGYSDHVSGHITLTEPDGSLLCTPWPFNWDEIRSSDILRIDIDGNLIEGKWQVSPGIPLHLALHRARSGVKCAAHNHTEYSQIWGAAHRLPPILDQTSALTGAKVVLVDEFDGPVGDYATAEQTVEKVGDGEISLLCGHGVLIVADDVKHLYRRAYSFEWRCRVGWQVAVLGGGVPLPAAAAKNFGSWQERDNFPGFWEGGVRREIRLDPSVLE